MVGVATRDLCALADVTKLVLGYTAGDDANTDLTLGELITEQSRDAMERCGREFKAVEASQPASRSFDIDMTAVRRRKVWLGDVAAVTTIATVDAQGTAVETVAAANYVLLPRVREDWQPYYGVWFPPNCAVPANLYPSYVMNVSATWGFQSVPTTVKDAVARLVIVRYLNDVTNQGTQFSDAADRLAFNVAASIRQALDALDRFYVPAF